MKRKFIAASALAGLCLFAASQASATVVTIAVTGTVIPWFGTSGIEFGSVNTGDTFKATYTFDTTQAGYTNFFIPGYSYAYGGSVYGYAPFGSAHIEVGNLTYDLSGNYLGNISMSTTGFQVLLYESDGGPGGILFETDFAAYDAFSGDFTQARTYTSDPSQENYLELNYYQDTVYDQYGDFRGSSTYDQVVSLIDKIVITTDADSGGDNPGGGSNDNAVPEPASLSLFAAGLMGAPFFRRKKNNQPVSACA